MSHPSLSSLDRLAIVELLAQSPDVVALLGQLVADLVSTPRRRTVAIRSLCDFLEKVPNDDQGRLLAAGLGLEIREVLLGPTFQQLEEEIQYHLKSGHQDFAALRSKPGALLISALLAVEERNDND